MLQVSVRDVAAVSILGASRDAAGGATSISGTVHVRNQANFAIAISKVTTQYFIAGTSWAPIESTATCLLGASGPIPIQPGAKLSCRFLFSMPAAINGKATTPGTLMATALLPSGLTASSTTVEVGTPAPAPPPSPTPTPAPARVTLTTTNVQATRLLGGSGGRVTGTATLYNAGSRSTHVREVEYLYFVKGSTLAPLSGSATCQQPLLSLATSLLGAPMPLQAGQAAQCAFALSPPSRAPGLLYTNAYLSDGSTVTSNSVGVSF
jgi:hypothetical protein